MPVAKAVANLPFSSMAIAAIASIVGTRNLKDSKMRNGIIGKTIKQYNNVKKEWVAATFEQASNYAHGGIPAKLSPITLIETLEGIQKISLTKAATMSKQAAMKSTVYALASVSGEQERTAEEDVTTATDSADEDEEQVAAYKNPVSKEDWDRMMAHLSRNNPSYTPNDVIRMIGAGLRKLYSVATEDQIKVWSINSYRDHMGE